MTERADLFQYGVVEFAVISADGSGGTDVQARFDPGTIGVLKLNGNLPEPRPQSVDVFELLQMLGVDELVLVIPEVEELDSQAATTASLRYDSGVVPRVVLVGPEL